MKNMKTTVKCIQTLIMYSYNVCCRAKFQGFKILYSRMFVTNNKAAGTND